MRLLEKITGGISSRSKKRGGVDLNHSQRIRGFFGSAYVSKRKGVPTGTNRAGTAFGFDSCANVHYVSDRSLLSNYRPVHNMSVDGLAGDRAVTGIGSLTGKIKLSNGKVCTFTLDDVLYIPDCGVNILSMHMFVNEIEQCTKFTAPKHGQPYLKFNCGEICRLVQIDDISTLMVDVVTNKTSRRAKLRNVFTNMHCFTSNRSVKVDVNFAHVLLGHPSKRKMEYLKAHKLIRGIEWDDGDLHSCYACAIGKSKRNPHDKKRVSTVYTERGQLVVTDVEGPISSPSFGGAEFAVHFTDMFSRFSKVYTMERKSQVGEKLLEYLLFCAENNVAVQCIQSDGAQEYVGAGTLFQKVCSENKITTRKSLPYMHFSNGAAERHILTTMQKAFCLLAHKSLTPQYWAYALLYASEMNNLMPHSAFGNKETPYWRWHERIPDLSGVHCFGSDVRINVPLDSGEWKKYATPKGWMGIYVGFDLNTPNQHSVFKPGEHGVPGSHADYHSRDCKFFEGIDEHNYLKSSDHPDFQKYAQLPKTGEQVYHPPDSSVGDLRRVAKKYNGQWYYGTASDDTDTGVYKYNVLYDDGDFEGMTTEEFKVARAEFAKRRNDPRAQAGVGEDFVVLPKKFNLIEIHGHKVIVDSFNVVRALMEISFTVKGADEVITDFVSLGALLSSAKKQIDDSDQEGDWVRVHSYLADHYEESEDETQYHQHLFKYYDVLTATRAARQNRDKNSMLAYEFHPDNSTLQFVTVGRRMVSHPVGRVRRIAYPSKVDGFKGEVNLPNSQSPCSVSLR